MKSRDHYTTCPYDRVPAASRWADAVGRVSAASLNPHLPTTLRVEKSTRIGTAGSCFAQHISRFLAARGFQYYIVEPTPDGLTEEEKARYNYEVFSARYGNIYTAMQLVQLMERAYGRFHPVEDSWRSPEGRWYDLFRPRIQPHGFASERELRADQAQHFKAVRRLFETTDVFVFTLGLTEAWRDRRDGSIYPICPGCGAGDYDAERYEFHNFSASEVTDHLNRFVNGLHELNPNAQVILTVSPVPLIATFEPRHVLQATVYSKAVLRVAAEETVRQFANVYYFASYEIITATAQTHIYFAADRRTVTEAGVRHVMDVFMQQFVGAASPELATLAATDKSRAQHVDVVCDEADFFAAVATNRNGK